MNDGLKMKMILVAWLLLLGIIGNFFMNWQDKPIPHHPLLYANKPAAPSVLTQTVKEMKFVTAIDSIYETKEYSDYIYTENDLLMAKEYRLYTTDKEKLFEKIFEDGNFEKSILIPAK